MALKAPSAVTIARQEQRIAEYGVRAARSSFLPQVQVGNGFTYNSPPIDSSANSVSGNNAAGSFVALNGIREYQTIVGSALEIDTSGRLRAALGRARADQNIATATAQITERDLRRAVANAFFRVLLARHLAAANRDVLQEAASFADRTRAMFTAGEAARADVVKAESQVAFLDQTVRAAELDAKIANAELASFWTGDVEPELQLVDNLASPAPPESTPPVQNIFLRRPEFQLLDAQRRGFEADYRRERSFLFPQLTLNLQYGVDANRLSVRDRGQAAFFTFNIPVFDWLRTRNLAQQFRTRVEQVDTRRDVTAREFSRDYQNALARVRLMYEQIGVTQTQVRTSEDNLRLARVRYEGGEAPALEVVAAQTQLSQARTNYHTVLANYAAAQFDLEVASGR